MLRVAYFYSAYLQMVAQNWRGDYCWLHKTGAEIMVAQNWRGDYGWK